MKVLIAASVLGLALVAGCFVAATAEEYRWKIKAPAKTPLGAKLHFTVEAATPDGTAAIDVPYVWRVDWVGVNGIRHQGRSFRPERIEVKGEPGMAILRILAADLHGRTVEVAHAMFEVTPDRPPAD